MRWKWITAFSFCLIVGIAALIAPSKKTDGKVLSYTNQDDMVCLAKNIYFEAATESTAGKIAVAWTVLNRVRHSGFPNSICEVVEQGLKYSNGIPKRDRCQFSWYCDGRSDEIRNIRVWRDSYRLATYVASGRDYLLDITDGSLFYHANYVQPKWAKYKRKTAKIDTHIFYR